MNKLEEICQKFLLIKKKLDKSEITFLCNHSYRSITGQIKELHKEHIPPNKITEKSKTNEKHPKEPKENLINIKSNSKNNNKSEYLKKMIMTLESSNRKTKSERHNKINIIKNSNNIKNNDKNNNVTPSMKNVSDNSPTIFNDEENNLNKNDNEDLDSKTISNNNMIQLNEEEENSNNKSNDNKKSFNSNKQKNGKYPAINIIDKDNINLNIKDIIIENFSGYGTQLGKLTEQVPKLNTIEKFYNEQREKIITLNLNNGNVIHIEAIKKIVHLFFNVLSKIFKCLTKETENICNICLNNILDLINLIIDYIKIIKKFIKNNNKNIDLLFLKDIKIIGNYCKYVLTIKKYDYEYMTKVQNKKEIDKINIFFNDYLKYFKTVNKLKVILKDNNMFMNHFTIQPTMLSFIDLFEMNRKIINYQLNAYYKKFFLNILIN